MPIHSSRFVAPALAVAAVLTLGACSSGSTTATSAGSTSSSSSSSSAGGDKTAFCKDNADLDAATINVSDPSQVAQVFENSRATLDDILKQAPSEVKADTQKLVDAATKVASTGDVTPFEIDPALQAALRHVDSYCDVRSPGGPSSSTSSSPSERSNSTESSSSSS